MTKANNLVTKKDFQDFSLKIDKKFDDKFNEKFAGYKDLQEFGDKLEKKIDDKFDVKFGEYFELIIKEMHRVFKEEFAEHDIKLQKQFEKHDYEISVVESQLNNNTHRIGALEKKVFGSVTT